MEHKRIYDNSDILLNDILQADNPTDMLSKCFEGISAREDEELRHLINKLQENGYITVNWANNKPYRIIINKSAISQLKQSDDFKGKKIVYINNQTVTIGNNNKIKCANIAANIEKDNADAQNSHKKSFAERHPVIISIIVSFAVGFILLFSFWEKIIAWIERLF